MPHVRELPSLRETTEIITPSGRRFRWADDEHDPENVGGNVRHSSTMPGGFETFEETLPRRPEIDYGDLERLSTVRRLGASGNVIWEGRLERAPRASGDALVISPSAVGLQAHLEDDKSVRVIYRDIDLNHWTGSSSERRAFYENLFTFHDGQVTPDATTGAPALRTGWIGPWGTGAARPISEAWYDAHGMSISSHYTGWRRAKPTTVIHTNTNWFWNTLLSTDDVATSTDSSAALRAAGPGSVTLTATTSTRKFAAMQFYFADTASGSDGAEYAIDWFDVAVYGDHGLTLRGTEPDAGYYDADIIGHALSTWCPLLKITDESLAASDFIIPHLAFLEPTTVGEIVRQATRFELREWAVWEDHTFWLYDRGARGRRWRTRVGPSQLEETGPQVDRLWESIIVQYQDVGGTTRTVGPPGSGADTESVDLKDSDPENPANQLGITRRDLLVASVSTATEAIRAGQKFLQEQKLLDSSGRATFVGHVIDDRGIVHPASHVRAGDYVSFVDAADTSYRRVVRAEHDRDSRSCIVDLDSPPEGLAALLERLGIGLLGGVA